MNAELFNELQTEKFAHRQPDRPVRILAKEGVNLTFNRGAVLDIGAGELREAPYFLEQGFREVVCVDHEQLNNELWPKLQARGVQFHLTSLKTFNFPKAKFDLVHAGYTLPLVDPRDFQRVFEGAISAVKRGGVFCGQLFGPRDSWNVGKSMSFHPQDEVDLLLSDLHTVSVVEVEKEGTESGRPKHWHIYHFVARKP